jgi:hypothetical protein
MLVEYSCGGVVLNEFLATHGKEKVVGMVIVDGAVERTQLLLISQHRLVRARI